jgi:hypothetical protein
MNNEQLELGKKLSSEIKLLEDELGKWQKSQAFYGNIGIKTLIDTGTADYCTFSVKSNFIDFKIVKTLTISKIEEKLTDLKTKFENL